MTRALALALALVATPALATSPRDAATLVSPDGEITCEGEWYWTFKHTRTYWTQGDACAITYEECLLSTVIDARGSHKVKDCSPDSQNSRGRKAGY